MKDPVYLAVMDGGWLGWVGVAVSPRGLLRLRMGFKNQQAFTQENLGCGDGEFSFSPDKTGPYLDQIRAFLRGDLRQFRLPIDWTGYTPFQKSVLEKTLEIPYGETRSYGQIAQALAKPGAARAVGQAEKRNQVPLVIPCHRVIGSDGSLTGYGGSINTDLKGRLLAFEKGKKAGS